MGFEDKLESLATLARSPAMVVVMFGAFWEFGIVPVIHGTLLILGTFIITFLAVEYKDELLRAGSALFSAVTLVLSGTRRAFAFLLRAAR